MATQTEIVAQQHISGDDNWRCDDGLSRPSHGKTLVDLGLSNIRPIMIALNDDPNVQELLDLCNPHMATESQGNFATFWRRVNAVVTRFK